VRLAWRPREVGDAVPPAPLIYNHEVSRKDLNEAFSHEFRPGARAFGSGGRGPCGCGSDCRLRQLIPAGSYAGESQRSSRAGYVLRGGGFVAIAHFRGHCHDRRLLRRYGDGDSAHRSRTAFLCHGFRGLQRLHSRQRWHPGQLPELQPLCRPRISITRRCLPPRISST
jgi:hypothetical protein